MACNIHWYWSVDSDNLRKRRVITACGLYCCLWQQCEVLCACRLGSPMATVFYTTFLSAGTPVQSLTLAPKKLLHISTLEVPDMRLVHDHQGRNQLIFSRGEYDCNLYLTMQHVFYNFVGFMCPVAPYPGWRLMSIFREFARPPKRYFYRANFKKVILPHDAK